MSLRDERGAQGCEGAPSSEKGGNVLQPDVVHSFTLHGANTSASTRACTLWQMSEHSKAQFKIPPDTGPEPTPTWLSYGQWTPPKKRQAPRTISSLC